MMNKDDFMFTSESVAEGHPDKMCDQISDAVLDAIIGGSEKPQRTRGAVECLATRQNLTIAGEYRIEEGIDLPIEQIAREVISDIGYEDPAGGFDSSNCRIIDRLHVQSSDIGDMVDRGGAGDQGLMFGFAADETPELMPLPIVLAHRLVERMDRVRKDRTVNSIRPDGKSQVTVRYEGGRPVAVEKVVLAVPHSGEVTKAALKETLLDAVVAPVLDSYGYKFEPRMNGGEGNYIVNGTGDWAFGGPGSDTGLTGRKIIVDTYGGMGRHGGGCFSGKDPTKVDRSASYMARYVAKNVVASGLAKKCEIQLAYVIGVHEPVSVLVETFGTGVMPDSEIEKRIREVFDLTPQGIIAKLDLFRPIYRNTAAYGHFGRKIDAFSWERTDQVEKLT